MLRNVFLSSSRESYETNLHRLSWLSMSHTLIPTCTLSSIIIYNIVLCSSAGLCWAVPSRIDHRHACCTRVKVSRSLRLSCRVFNLSIDFKAFDFIYKYKIILVRLMKFHHDYKIFMYVLTLFTMFPINPNPTADTLEEDFVGSDF